LERGADESVKNGENVVRRRRGDGERRLENDDIAEQADDKGVEHADVGIGNIARKNTRRYTDAIEDNNEIE
jgi:hypothetical protein